MVWSRAGLVLAAVGIVLTSCTTKISNLQSDPSFTPASVTENAGAILGCASIVTDTLDVFVLSSQLSVHLERHLAHERPDIRLLSWGQTRMALGDSLMRQCLNSIESFGVLDPMLLKSLRAPLRNDVRYVVAHRIDSDQIERKESDDNETINGKIKKVGTVLSTERSVAVRFSVFDLDLGKRVWSATVEGGDTNSRKIPLDEEADTSGWLGKTLNAINVLDDIFGGDDELPFPEPVSQVEILEDIYAKFAKSLPKSDD